MPYALCPMPMSTSSFARKAIPYQRIDGELGTNLFAKCQSFDRVKILNKKTFVKFFIILVDNF